MIEITDKKIDVEKVTEAASSLQGGAINVFIGTVRNQTGNRKVLRLEYECYNAMAIAEIEKIISEVKRRWPVIRVAISHRVGTLQAGDVAVAIAVSTPHRKDSFDACQFVIDTLKQTVPIWKKEVYEGGEEWVSAHP